eukprot:GGOE01061588.1.p1 GENE.GGOE01061588.1~~GGOE01061588.1.p1  ORF type:complete len:338 (+),score=81.44 GGOE01061588.1:27-1016(+)
MTYRVMQVHRLGRLDLEEVPRRPLTADHVRIAVEAAGINFADMLIVNGQYQEKPPLPFTPGGECAGVVLESTSPNFRPGDRVLAATQLGAWSEEMEIPAALVFRYPDSWSPAQAAAFPVAYGTAHVALLKARLHQNEVVLVTGASGGTGAAAVSIAKAMGARVIATARGKVKCDFCRSLAADLVIDLLEEDMVKKVMEFTGGKGVAVIYETVGGQLLNDTLKCVRWGGRVLVVGFAGGSIPKVPANILLVKNTDVLGVYWGAHFRHAPQVVSESFVELMRLMVDGKLPPPLVTHQFPLLEAKAALEALQRREIVGKAVLTVDRHRASKL